MTFSIKRKAKRPDMPRMLSRAFEDMPYIKLKPILPLLLLTLTLSGCGIYNGGWERGGELTSSFLERIQETDKAKEDYLIEKDTK